MTRSPRNRVATLVQQAQSHRGVATFDRRCKRARSALVDRFGEQQADVMRQEMLQEFRRLAPLAPQIGRDGSPFARNLVGGYSALAAYRVVQQHGGTLEDAARFLNQVIRAEMEGTPKPLRAAMKWYMFSGLRRRQLERGARRSQERRYPGDWVLEVVPSDGQDFDLGVDVTECGIVKYLHAQNADELTPYLCEWDYIMSEVLGNRLQRTKTLSWGCDRCDFRNSKRGHTTSSWPPLFVERSCGQPQAPPKEPVAAS